jgi:hypothetical protein
MRLHRRSGSGFWAVGLGVVALVCMAGPPAAEAKLLELQLRLHGGGVAGIYGTGDYDPVNSTDAEAAAGEDFFLSRRGGAFGGTLNVEVLFVDFTYEFYQLADSNGLGSTLNNFLVGFDWDFKTGKRWVITPYILAGFGLATQNNSWLNKSYPQIELADLESRMAITRIGVRAEIKLGKYFRLGFDIGGGYHYGITTASAANNVEEGHSHGFHVIGNVSLAFVWNVFPKKKKPATRLIMVAPAGAGRVAPPPGPGATPPTPAPAPGPSTTPAPRTTPDTPVPPPSRPTEVPPRTKTRPAPVVPSR